MLTRVCRVIVACVAGAALIQTFTQIRTHPFTPSPARMRYTARIRNRHTYTSPSPTANAAKSAAVERQSTNIERQSAVKRQSANNGNRPTLNVNRPPKTVPRHPFGGRQPGESRPTACHQYHTAHHWKPAESRRNPAVFRHPHPSKTSYIRRKTRREAKYGVFPAVSDNRQHLSGGGVRVPVRVLDRLFMIVLRGAP